MLLLTEFLLRLSFGLSAAMIAVSGRQVTSGYFRNNSYVLLGILSLTALLGRAVLPEVLWPTIMAAIFSYVCSACWLYERPAFGKAALSLIAACTAFALVTSMPMLGGVEERIQKAVDQQPVGGEVYSADLNRQLVQGSATALRMMACVSSGLLLGITMAAMLLGHWYLNSPTMQITPLRKLLVAMAFVIGLQMVVCALGVAGELALADAPTFQWWLFVALRWLFGLFGVAILTFMAWRTLDIPNTQSATGILYVAVIGTFVGETMSLLLSRESVYPL